MRVASGQTIEILAHRGLWQKRIEGNTRPALAAALAAGFGLETDIRDHAGEIVIAHDPPVEAPFTLRHLLEDYRASRSSAALALNIKADGLRSAVEQLLKEFEVANYFVFDMSVPDMLHWKNAGLRFFTRHSDVERTPVLYENAAGVWLDGFDSTWFTAGTISAHLMAGKDVCVVSPELHGRDAQPVWQMIASVAYDTPARLSVCTDWPQKFSAASR
jgi:glycerophosphoryl diester phosphodiesterase